MIKCTKLIDDGKKVVVSDVPEDEYPHYQEFLDMAERMKNENCQTFIIRFEEGLQILFTLPIKQ